MKSSDVFGDLEAVIAHVSDLHFCDVFCNDKDRLSSLIGAAPHHYNLLVALDTCFLNIPAQLKERFGLESEPKIDMAVATGDLTTTANPIAYEEVNNFLRWSKYMGINGPRIGLEMTSNVLVVPGNHDTWFTRLGWRYRLKRPEDRSEAYERYFPKCPEWNVRQFGNADFIFIGINSNRGLRGPLNISKGRVDEGELADIAKELAKRKSNTARRIFAIVLLHHHLYLLPNMDEQRLTELINAQYVLNTLSSMGIDMVLFGHRHQSFEAICSPLPAGQGSSLLVSCAGSASQMNSSFGNSFKTYLFFHRGIRIIKYEFDGLSKFNPVRSFQFNYPNGSPFT